MAELTLIMACGGERVQSPTAEDTTADPIAESPDLGTIVRSAIEAHQAGDYERALALSLEAEAMLPNHPLLLFNTACAMALTGDSDAALDRLERIAAMQDVAASQWRSFDENGRVLVDQFVEPTILRLPLTE